MNELIIELFVPLAFLAVGALTELITMKNPTPGEKVGAVAGVFFVSGLGFLFPEEWAWPVVFGFVVAKSGRITGSVLSWLTDKARLWVDDYAEA